MLLRLAVLLNRSRNQAENPTVGLEVGDQSIKLTFDPVWLKANPLTVADLEREKNFLASVDDSLEFS